MIVDAFLANDEWDLVVFRMRYLTPTVSKFYIGESTVTFAGRPKKPFFANRLRKFQSLGFDVVVINLAIPEELLANRDRWVIETYARDTLLEAVASQHPEDLVLFSDVDEVPSQSQVYNLAAQGSELNITSIPTQVCLRKANWIEYQPHQWRGKWGNGLLGKHWIPRIRRGKYPFVEGEPGAHLSYVGMSPADVRRKYQAFSHAELDRDEMASEEFLSFADFFHISHLGRALEPGAGLLTVIQLPDFTSVQKQAFEQHPSWFSLDPIRQPTVRRLVASWILFGHVRGTLTTSLPDAHAPLYSWSWIRHALMYLMVWSGWKTLNALGIMRLIKRTPKLVP